MPRGPIKIEIPPPGRGFRSDLALHRIPDNYLAQGKNVLVRDGNLITRPGVVPVVSSAPSANRVMGLFYYVDHTGTSRLVVGTTTGFFVTQGGSWTNITGTPLSGATDDQIVFTVFMLGSSTRLVAVNDKDPPQVYTGGSSFANLGGSPPIAKSVASAFQRVILGNITVAGQRRPSELRISAFQDPETWPVLNVVNLPDTADSIVAVKSLSDQAFVVYKTRSQWVGVGAGEIFPFIFELRSQQPGPVSPNSVVQAEDKHYYIGLDGDVYQFDGVRTVSIGGVVKRTIQASLDFSLAGRTHGFYDRINREIWWFWRPVSGAATSGIVMRLPYDDVPLAFSPLLEYSIELTASSDWDELASTAWDGLSGTWDGLQNTYPTWNSFGGARRPGGVVGRSNGQVYKFGNATDDDGNAFDAMWTTPLRAAAGIGENILVDTIESFFKLEVSPTPVHIQVLVSNNLESEGVATPAQIVDASESGVRRRAQFVNVTGRYAALRHTMPNTRGGKEYRGSVVYVFQRGED